jgi:hypothetical protein
MRMFRILTASLVVTVAAAFSAPVLAKHNFREKPAVPPVFEKVKGVSLVFAIYSHGGGDCWVTNGNKHAVAVMLDIYPLEPNKPNPSPLKLAPAPHGGYKYSWNIQLPTDAKCHITDVQP